MSEINLVRGKFSGKLYNAADAIRIMAPLQAATYWCNGVEPLDIYPSKNFKTGKPVIVFVFKRSETKEVFDAWVKAQNQDN